MAQSLDEILGQLAPVYDPQANAVKGQIDQLPAYYQAQQQGLDTAKTNAFGDITNGANARGMVYSGAPIAEQQKYVGATYLPAVAGLAKNQNDQRFQLTTALNDLNAKRYSEAYGVRQKQLDTEAQAAAQAAQLAAQERASQRAAALAQGGTYSPTNPTATTKPGGGDPVQSAYGIIGEIAKNHDSLLPNGGFNWGGVANYLARNGISTARGSAGDRALNLYFNRDGYNGYLQALKNEGLA